MNPSDDPRSVAKKAWTLYERGIQEMVEPQHSGAALVIDVESGDYEVGPDEDVVFSKLEARRPAGTFYVMRVGSQFSQFVGAPIE